MKAYHRSCQTTPHLKDRTTEGCAAGDAQRRWRAPIIKANAIRGFRHFCGSLLFSSSRLVGSNCISAVERWTQTANHTVASLLPLPRPAPSISTVLYGSCAVQYFVWLRHTETDPQQICLRTMSRAFTPTSPGASRRGVETFKTPKRDHLSLLEQALASDLPLLAEPYDASTAFPFSYSTFPPFVTDDLCWPLEKPVQNDDIATEIDSIVDNSRSAPPTSPTKRQRATSSTLSCVHERALDDSHYPYKVQRKNRTKMRSGVCVWCAAQALMALDDSPKLRRRTSGSDCDWERWIRKLGTPGNGFLGHLSAKLMPKHEVLRIITPKELDGFYKEMAGALIEIALREHRRGTIDERAVMTQVRSSKYHKAARVAKIIETFYE